MLGDRMTSGSHGHLSSRSLLVPAAWLAMPIVVSSYLVLRYGVGGSLGIAVSQVVYLLPIVLAATFTTAAAVVGKPRTQARLVWVLLAVMSGCLLLSEGYLSLMLVTKGSTPLDALFDALNAVAVMAIIAVFCLIGGVVNGGWTRALRIVFDAAALLSLGFVLIYRLWAAPLNSVAAMQAVRMSVYALLGVLMLVATVGCVRYAGSAGRTPWAKAIFAAFSVYSLGMILWPMWSMAVSGVRPAPVGEAVVVTLYLLGYYLLFVGGLMRTVAVDMPWPRVIGGAPRAEAWPGVVLSVLVFVSVVVLGVAVARADKGSVDQFVYFATLAVATTCTVARTTIVSFEWWEIQEQAHTDPVTGVANPRSFEWHLAEHLASVARYGEPFALLLLDIDGFARVNSAMSLSAGDRVLQEVAQAIARACAERDHVFRLSGDEFAVIVGVHTRDEAFAAARCVEAAVRGVVVPDEHLTVSIGFALSPDDAVVAETMIRRADGALAWAKRHGKGRIMGFDERIERALGQGGRGRYLAEDATYDMVRALAAATDARDSANVFHSRNVAALAGLLAGELGFAPEHVERVQIAALLHDVGKIALPNAMLGGRTLSVREREHASGHSELGQRMLESLAIEGVATWVRSHHERWDGTGIPDALAGESIPLEARIIALADAYDGMTAGKRYGAPMSKAAALQEIDLGMGTRFDPELAERFIAVVATTDALGWSDEWPAA